MANRENRTIAQSIFETSSTLHMLQEGSSLPEKVHNACTIYQMFIVKRMRDEGFLSGIVSDPDAQVKNLKSKGHTIGFVKANKNSNEIIAFDATIAQNGVYHKSRKARIWFGNVNNISRKLRKEFGGRWDVFQIKGAVGDFS